MSTQTRRMSQGFWNNEVLQEEHCDGHTASIMQITSGSTQQTDQSGSFEKYLHPIAQEIQRHYSRNQT